MNDGIYFNMSEDEYFANDRLDVSGIKLILDSPTRYWFNSRLNPLYEEPDKKCFYEGKLWHKIILEPNKFEENYKIIPDYVGGLPRNSKAFKDWCALQDKTLVEKSTYNKIMLNLAYLQEKDQMLDSRLFQDGMPEVSIFFTYRGVKCKARIDYLKLNQIIDLKTILHNGGNFDEAIKQAFFKYRTYMQLTFYQIAAEAAKGFDLKDVHGSIDQIHFFEEWKQSDMIIPLVVFINKSIPQSRVKVFIPQKCPDLYRLANESINKGINIYQKYVNKYGKTKAWLEENDKLSVFADEDFPQLFFNIMEAKENDC